MSQPPPLTLTPYLYAKGSLTALLEKQAGQALTVKVVHESYEPMDFDSRQLLELPAHRPMMAWVREVLLFGNLWHDDNPVAWVRAKSLFPIRTLTGSGKRLRHLKQTPIGYVLFKRHRTLPHKRYYYHTQGQFGRQTVYDWQGQKLLIDELFLAEFEQMLTL